MRCLDRHYRTAFSSRVLFQSTARGMEKRECTKRKKQEDKMAKESSSFSLAWVMLLLLTVCRPFVCVCKVGYCSLVVNLAQRESEGPPLNLVLYFRYVGQYPLK